MMKDNALGEMVASLALDLLDVHNRSLQLEDPVLLYFLESVHWLCLLVVLCLSGDH